MEKAIVVLFGGISSITQLQKRGFGGIVFPLELLLKFARRIRCLTAVLVQSHVENLGLDIRAAAIVAIGTNAQPGVPIAAFCNRSESYFNETIATGFDLT